MLKDNSKLFNEDNNNNLKYIASGFCYNPFEFESLIFLMNYIQFTDSTLLSQRPTGFVPHMTIGSGNKRLGHDAHI